MSSLAYDQSSWQPLSELQTQLRIATLTGIRDATVSRRKGQLASVVPAAAAVLHSMKSAIRRDWQRVVLSTPQELTSGICCSSRLRGRHPFMTMDYFGYFGRT